MRRSPILAVAAPALLLLAGAGFQSVGPADEPSVFDPAAMVSFEGEVLTVTEVDADTGNGVHMVVRDTDGQEVEVRIGPAAYLAQQGIQLNVGDQVEVRGVPMRIDDAPTFVAAAIVRGDDSWVLRDESGQPAWARNGMLGANGMGTEAGGGCMMHGQGGMMHGEGGMMRGQGGMMGSGGRGMGMHQGQGAGAMRGGSGAAGKGMGQGMGTGMQGCGGMQAGEISADGAPMCRRGDGAAAETSAPTTEPTAASGCQCGCAMQRGAQR